MDAKRTNAGLISEERLNQAGFMMGGFSASYLIWSADAELVAEEVKRLLEVEGWRPTNQELEDEDMWGVGGRRRGIIICKPIGGWVAVIDSAAMVAQTPTTLSQTLSTSDFNFHVHDSDFWSYVLYRSSEKIDAFTSIDEQEYFGAAFDDGTVDAELKSCTLNSSDQRWALLEDYLRDGASRSEFDNTFLIPDLTAIDTFTMTSGEAGLGQFLSLIGAEPALAYCSYRYWMEDASFGSLDEHCHMRFEQTESGDVTITDVEDDHQRANLLPFAPLHMAAMKNETDTIEHLVAEGFYIDDIPRAYTVTALGLAACEGNAATVRKLISLGADIHNRGKDGTTPLHNAVQSSHVENVCTLIELGANVHEFMVPIGSLLHVAVSVQSTELVSLLLANGVDPLVRNNAGFTPQAVVATQRLVLMDLQAKLGKNTPKEIENQLKKFELIAILFEDHLKQES